MKFLLLHLSDIHLQDGNDLILARTHEIAAATNPFIRNVDMIFIVVTGDIVFSGDEKQFALAEEFIGKITSQLRLETEKEINLIICPGNHDCDFSGDQSLRKIVVDNITSNTNISELVIDQCVSVQKNFFSFRDKSSSINKIYDDRLWTSYCFISNGMNIIFECINASWMSELKETQGKFVFPVEHYHNLQLEHNTLRFSILHHPLHWYSQATFHPFKNLIYSISDIVITGHEHKSGFGEKTDADSGQSAYITGGILQDRKDPSASTFNVACIDLTAKEYRCVRYFWDGKLYQQKEEIDLSAARKLPIKIHKNISLTESFKKQLDDPGAPLGHSRKKHISLDDIYVFPNLKKTNERSSTRHNTISANYLKDINAVGKGILLKGEEKSGKTSLIYQLFKHYYSNGYFPLILNGEDLRPNEKDIRNAVDKAIIAQYGKEAKTEYEQLSMHDKILFIDDFDSVRVTCQQREKILLLLSSEFSGVLLSVSDMFDYDEVVSDTPSSCMIGYNKYQIQEFGFNLRLELICKWTDIGDHVGKDTADIIHDIDRIEKFVNGIMGKNIVPRIPIYLLTLLQIAENNPSPEIRETAYGDCYLYLITGSLLRAGVKPDELGEILNYCKCLSWEFCKLETKALTRAQMQAYHDWFSIEYHRTDFDKRLNILIESKIININGLDYIYCYPYIYYYFLGNYLSDNLSNADIKARVEDYCNHLYVKDYSSAILFLAHHSPDPFVYEKVVNVLTNIFSEREPVKYDDDTKNISDLIQSTPEIIYKPRDVVQHRKEVRTIQDDVSESSSEQESKIVKEDRDNLSLSSKLSLLIKTVEILGQILKNQYGSINNSTKISLLTETFNGPLRALSNFYDFIATNHSLIIQGAEHSITEIIPDISEEKKKKIAVDYAFFIIIAISFGIIHKTSLSIGSDKLLALISEISGKNGSTSYKLIELSVRLESHQGIPRKLIGELASKAKGNAFAWYILQMIIINHMYMFKTKTEDKQWLCTVLNIPMDVQRGIELKSKNTKRLK